MPRARLDQVPEEPDHQTRITGQPTTTEPEPDQPVDPRPARAERPAPVAVPPPQPVEPRPAITPAPAKRVRRRGPQIAVEFDDDERYVAVHVAPALLYQTVGEWARDVLAAEAARVLDVKRVENPEALDAIWAKEAERLARRRGGGDRRP